MLYVTFSEPEDMIWFVDGYFDFNYENEIHTLNGWSDLMLDCLMEV